jgi:hypothetical protein
MFTKFILTVTTIIYLIIFSSTITLIQLGLCQKSTNNEVNSKLLSNWIKLTNYDQNFDHNMPLYDVKKFNLGPWFIKQWMILYGTNQTDNLLKKDNTFQIVNSSSTWSSPQQIRQTFNKWVNSIIYDWIKNSTFLSKAEDWNNFNSNVIIKREDGHKLSVVNPLEVLRQRLVLELERKRIEVNKEMLKKLGKRSISTK